MAFHRKKCMQEAKNNIKKHGYTVLFIVYFE